jgi:GT2 family glycosyltransferase
MPCTHPNPRLCDLLGRHIVGRLYEIWHARALTPEACGAYRHTWCTRRGVTVEAALALEPIDPHASAYHFRPRIDPHDPTALPCCHRGERLRDGECRPCQHEGLTTIPVWACAPRGECVLRGTVRAADGDSLPVCLTCPQREPAAVPDVARNHPFPKHVTRWAVGITAAPRRQPTVARCAASVRAAGWEPTLFAEPGTNGLPAGFAIVERPQRLGIWQNYVQTLRDLLTAHPEAQAIVVLQDDVVLCRDVREFLEHDLWPGLNPGMVSLYVPEEKEAGGQAGCDRRGGTVIGICAAVFPRTVAERLVDSPFARAWRGCHHRGGCEPDPLRKKAIDTGICEQLKAWGLPVWNYRPSLAQHIADTSAVGHGGRHQVRQRHGLLYRQSRHFPGEQTSAFDLFAHPLVRYDLPQGYQRYREAGPLPERPVTVVIPGYGCEDLALRCLDALNAHAAGVVSEIVYVDNASPAGTVETVERHGSRIPLRIIRNQTNRGFSTACNQGIEAAAAGSHVLLLNTDAFVGPHCVERLRFHAERHDRIAAVGPITGDDGAQSLKHPDNRRAAKYRGDFNRDRYEIATAGKLRRNYITTRDVLSGFCMLLARPALDALGPLRTDGALASGLGADDEWCHRARAAGWRNLVVNNAWCAHLHKSSFRRAGIDRGAQQRAAVAQLKAEGIL